MSGRLAPLSALACLAMLVSAVQAVAEDPVVIVIDPARPAVDADASVLTLETIAFREHRERLARVPVPDDPRVGGPSLIGLTWADRSRLRTASEDVRAKLEDWDGYGAAVATIMAGSPSEAAWLQPGDVIVRFSGLWIDSPDMLVRVATRTEPGREYEVWYVRDGQVYRTYVVPGARDEVQAGADGPVQPIEGVVFEMSADGEVPPRLVPPRLLSEELPEYPRAARRVLAGGRAVFRVVVGPEGEPVDVALLRGTGRKDLDEAAEEALLLRRYDPARAAGRPVSIAVPVIVVFSADGPPEPPEPAPAPKRKRSRRGR